MGGDVADAVARRVNLIEALQDAHPACPDPPEDAPETWSEEDIRSYFSSGGEKVPSRASGEGEGVDAAGAAMGALDVNGEPMPPSTRADGKYMCQRIGCSAVYDAQNNPDGCCRYHAVRVVRRVPFLAPRFFFFSFLFFSIFFFHFVNTLTNR